jgi:hypothetical protein
VRDSLGYQPQFATPNHDEHVRSTFDLSYCGQKAFRLLGTTSYAGATLNAGHMARGTGDIR